MENVANIRDYRDNGINVKELIEMYLNSKNDEKTVRNYSTHVRDFFKLTKGKDIEELIEKDLEIRHADFDKFISSLKEEGKSNSTINAKLTAIRGLFKFLSSRKKDIGFTVEINTDIFKDMQKVKTLDNYHGDLEYDEVFLLSDLAKQEEKQPLLKSLFILFSLRTAFRKDEVLSVRWDDFILMPNGTYFLEVEGKYGAKHRRNITPEFHKELENAKEDETYVFPIDPTELQRTKDRLCELANIPKKRKIVLHSIRGAAITRHYEIHKDIVATKEYANHKSVETTLHYIKKRNYGYDDIVTMTETIENNDLSTLSHEELLNLIKNNKDLEFQVKTALVNSKKNS